VLAVFGHDGNIRERAIERAVAKAAKTKAKKTAATATVKSAGGAISLRALSRATLARQLLLARQNLGVVDTVSRLFGMQAQLARPPFVGLWSRLVDLARGAVTKEVEAARLVRATWVRATIHLLSAHDYAAFRATLQPALDRAIAGILKDRVRPSEIEPCLQAVRAFLAKSGPMTFNAIRDELARVFPGGDIRGLAYMTRCTLPLVLVADAGATFGWTGNAGFATAETAMKPTLAKRADTAAFVKRYLAAFGPASVKDAESYSFLPKLGDTFEAMRGELVSLRDDKGRELFDLPGAPRPHEDTAAPVRFLPEFDSVVLAHHDRRRLITEANRPKLATKNLFVPATFTVDGMLAGKWTLETKKGVATLGLTAFEALPKSALGAIEAEAHALATFAEPGAKRVELRWQKD